MLSLEGVLAFPGLISQQILAVFPKVIRCVVTARLDLPL